MAAGAIPPPLFFGLRRYTGIFSPAHGILENMRFEQPQQITRLERPARSSPTKRAITAEG
jgi:hypothetical protein